MPTNHDMDSRTPFATVLVGQPTLRRMIKLGVLAALDQRIAVRYQMTGMTPEETGSYIRHHQQLAGRDGVRCPDLFSDDATAQIHDAARGKAPSRQPGHRRAHRHLYRREEDRRAVRRPRRHQRGHISRMSTPTTL